MGSACPILNSPINGGSTTPGVTTPGTLPVAPVPVVRSNAQSRVVLQWHANFQTDQQENVVASLIAVDLNARRWRRNCSNRVCDDSN